VKLFTRYAPRLWRRFPILYFANDPLAANETFSGSRAYESDAWSSYAKSFADFNVFFVCTAFK
jgi:hypothetical protein